MIMGADSACPGALHAVEAADGLLARIRIPGGLIDAGRLAALGRLARRCGSGIVEITSRANVQVRGLHPDRLDELAAGLTEAGLVRSVAHDRVRNVVASPFAGIDPGERLDVRPLVRALDAGLIAEPRLAALPAKFAFVLDGGGRPFDPGRADLAATAVPAGDGRTLMHLSVGGRPTGLGCMPARAVAVLLRSAGIGLDLLAARAGDDPAPRLSRIPDAVARIVAASGDDLARAPVPVLRSLGSPPLGTLAAVRPGRASVVPSVPLAYLTGAQADGIAALAQWFAADLRLAPWRGVVLGDVAAADVAEIGRALLRLGLRVDAADGYAGLAACAGTQGCRAALADVRGDAARLAERIAEAERGGERRVFLAGCEKRCGMRGGADVALVADVLGYDVRADGAVVRLGASAQEAIEEVLRASGGAAPKTLA